MEKGYSEKGGPTVREFSARNDIPISTVFDIVDI
jgi:hypothetical protein